MGWLKHKKRKSRAAQVAQVASAGTRLIFNNLVRAWEVWDLATDAPGAVFRGVRDVVGNALEETEDVKGKLSRDYDDAERYVKEGVSEAKTIWGDLKEAFTHD